MNKERIVNKLNCMSWTVKENEIYNEIMLAVNSHEALLEALKIAEARLRVYATWIKDDGFRNVLHGRAKMTKNEEEIMNDATANADDFKIIIQQAEEK